MSCENCEKAERERDDAWGNLDKAEELNREVADERDIEAREKKAAWESSARWQRFHDEAQVLRKTAEAERDALKADLAEAVGLLMSTPLVEGKTESQWIAIRAFLTSAKVKP